MKIFLDTANTELIQKWAQTGLIDGITTNPTHLSKEGKNPAEQVLAICDILPSGSISVEVVETEPKKVYTQAREIAALCDNIVVKIPCHPPYYAVIKQLVDEGIALNITLLFSLVQGLMMAKLGVHYISPFIGRLDDIGHDGIALIKQLRHMLDWYGFETELLAASIRDTQHFENVIIAGADIATVPVAVFEKSLTHELTDKGMAQFLADWKKLNISQFP
ncbi:MAG TPA: transaldolase family protein [Candidatus Babeliales bacterium]|jgi:transaldolase|nr:transaldolase family protein [Candidatus Babeliales bacterium]